MRQTKAGSVRPGNFLWGPSSPLACWASARWSCQQPSDLVVPCSWVCCVPIEDMNNTRVHRYGNMILILRHSSALTNHGPIGKSLDRSSTNPTRMGQ